VRSPRSEKAKNLGVGRPWWFRTAQLIARVSEKSGKETEMAESKIKCSLLEQLKNKGADTAHFRALVDDYVWMDAQVRKMKASIRRDGTMIPAVSAAGKEYEKENPAVKNVILYSRQMLAILRDMGLNTENTVTEDDDEL